MTPAEFVDNFRIALRAHDCEVETVRVGKRTKTVDRADAWNALAVVVEMRRYLADVEVTL